MAQWDQAMEEHREYVENIETSVPARKVGLPRGGNRPAFGLQKCRGSCIVKSDAFSIDSDYAILTLDICDGRVKETLYAAVDFGVFEGTMILSHSDAVLTQPVDENHGEKHEHYSEYDSEYDCEYDSEDDPDGDQPEAAA
jgi:hypothetical protein